jgi:hypothetical protein
MKLSILITLLNEELVLSQTHKAISEQLDSMLVSEELSDYEILYIDDGSRDKTLELIDAISQENHRVKYISFSRNFGRESGILAGFKYATGDAVMVMDGDLQHPPYLIPLFVNAFKEGYDIVSGQRTREGESFIGSFFARCFYAFSNHSMDVQLTDGKSELRLLSKRAVDVFVSLPEYNRFNKGLYEWIGFKEKVISYKNEVRKAGKSKFGFKKSMDYAVQGIISFNDRPLRICIQFGFVSMALSLLYIIYELFKVLFSADYTSGYFTTIASIILFSSVQLIFIGVLGEYIGKIYYEVKNRPHFIIAKSNIEQAERDRIG